MCSNAGSPPTGTKDGQKTFKFSNAKGTGSGYNRTVLLSAEANVNIKTKSFESVLAEFKRAHEHANHEFAYEVDEDGYVTQYIEGDNHSVGIKSSRNTKGSIIIHNHPSGSAFSQADLLSTSSNRYSRGIIATGKVYDYVFRKGTHFKAKAFMDAVKTVEIKGVSYDEAVDTWLTANQKKYGYKYTRVKN